MSKLLAEWIEWDRRRAHRQASWGVASGANWAAMATPNRGTYAEIERRRVQPAGQLWREFTQRHGGEYRGGAVDWSTGRLVGRAVV